MKEQEKEKEFEFVLTRKMCELIEDLEQDEGEHIAHAFCKALWRYTYRNEEPIFEGETKCLKYPFRFATEEIDAKREYCTQQSRNGKRGGRPARGASAGADEYGEEETGEGNREGGGAAVWQTAEPIEEKWLQELITDARFIEEAKKTYPFVAYSDFETFKAQCLLKHKTHKDKGEVYAHCARWLDIQNRKRDKGRDIYGEIAGAHERRTEDFAKYAAAKLAASDPNKEEAFEDIFSGEPEKAAKAARANEADAAFISALDNEFKGVTTGKRIMAFYWGDCKRRGHWITEKDEQQADIVTWARSKRDEIAGWERRLTSNGA